MKSLRSGILLSFAILNLLQIISYCQTFRSQNNLKCRIQDITRTINYSLANLMVLRADSSIYKITHPDLDGHFEILGMAA